MARQVGKKQQALRGVKGYRGRSAAYEYVRDNLQKLVARGFGAASGPSWQELADYLNRQGQRNTHGSPLSRGSALKIFERAKRDAAADERTALTGVSARRGMPSRVPTTWAPQPAAVSGASGTAQTTANGNPRARTADEKIAALRQEMAERSGLTSYPGKWSQK